MGESKKDRALRERGEFEAHRDQVLSDLESVGIDKIAKALAKHADDRAGAPIGEQRRVRG